MRTEHTDVVAEYLREIDLRLAGLPVLQRRELLTDLAAHIETERAERNLQGEAELIEVLERLGSPEAVAAAAYAEAGPLPPPVAPPMPPMPSSAPAYRPPYWLAAVVLGVVAIVVVLCGGFFMARSTSAPDLEQPPAPPARVEPRVP